MKFVPSIALTMIFGLIGLLNLQAQSANARLQVIPEADAATYRLDYQGISKGDLVIRIQAEDGQLLHREVVKDQNQLARVYHLRDVEEGEYRFVVSGPNGPVSQTVTYPGEVAPELGLDVLKDPAQPRYQVMIDANPEREVVVSIYDSKMNLLYQERATAAEQSRKVYDLARIADRAVIFTVSDAWSAQEEMVSLQR